MKRKLLNILPVFLCAAALHSCSCLDASGPAKRLLPLQILQNIYPYYEGLTYPDEINTEEAVMTGNIFYADPGHPGASMSNPGTDEEHPWTSLQDVIESGMIETMEPAVHPYTDRAVMTVKNPGAPVRAGDTIVLKSGHHGDIFIQDYFNSGYINVIADAGATASRLHVQSGCRWRFRGLTVRPDTGHTEGYPLVFLESHGWHGPVYNITIDDCTLYSAADASAWSMDDWNSLSCNGIVAYGQRMTIRRNTLRNVNFGLTISGNFGLAKGNTIENFAGDGMRGLGNDLFFEYNTARNCYDVNANHDDGFQSWSINDDPPRERVVLRGNVIINYSDPAQPFRGALQGIGCFDGFYINWVIENNVVITDHWHGISLYGAINCRIVNNTVIDINDETPGPPWIAIVPHGSGIPSRNCLIRNNIATAITATEGVTADHNYIIESYSSYGDIFVNPAAGDLHLQSGAPVIDAGAAESAPLIDIEGKERPGGNGFDLGAYEY
ncbi:MAG: right-handed parallel beta-helix repeat-containing protein [Spirochaetes bacterium]|nr:right-handed parallel beta-helix repeat-containing protein [Spirochaetota bacterium]